MLITKELEILITRQNIDWFKSKKYDCNLKDIIIINVLDLPRWSERYIEYSCDYCGVIYDRKFYKYMNGKEKIIDKDCCTNCQHIKLKETLNKKYENKIVKEKIKVNKIVKEKIKINKEINLDTHVESTLTLPEFLRGKIDSWKKDSLIFYNNRCILTGETQNIEVHHIYNFHKILIDVLNILGYSLYDNISKYTYEELERMRIKCIELHYKYGLGAPITRRIHRLFHFFYGNDNMPEQFEEFKQKWNNSDFKDIL